MFKFLSCTIIGIAMAYSAPLAFSQDTQDMIVVTGSRIDRSDIAQASTPNVTIKVPADFILTELSYESGTRDPAERKAELNAMFDKVTLAATNTSGISLEAGEVGYSAPIETVTFPEIYRTGYGSQKSTFQLVLRVEVEPGDEFDNLRVRAEAFTDAIGLVGRTEDVFGDEQYIGIINASRHRETLLQAIHAELQSLKRIFNASSIEISGLGQKVVTQPTGVLELELYIPYSITITTKR